MTSFFQSFRMLLFAYAYLAAASSILGEEKQSSEPLIPLKSSTDEISMQTEIDWLNHNICRYYLPQLCKRKNHKIIWADEVNSAKKAVGSTTTYQEYLGIVRGLINSLRDLHISMEFYSFEENKNRSIPITFYTVDNRLFVKAIYSPKIPNIKVHDEVIRLGGIAPMDYLKRFGQNAMESRLNGKVPNLIAHFLLVHRSERGDRLPGGDLVLKLRDHQTRVEKTAKAVWEIGCEWIAPLTNDVTAPVPNLGKLENHIDAGTLKAKWFQSRQSEAKIGYLQINSFQHHVYGNSCDRCQSLRNFEQLIEDFEKSTELLVLDLRNNFGGSINHCLSLTSCLTKSNLKMYEVCVLLDQIMIDSYRKRLLTYEKWIKEGIPMSLSSIKTSDRLKTACEYGVAPITRQHLLDHKIYISKLIQHWKKGERMSGWHSMFRSLSPSCKARYTKPLIVLINENSMSASEIMTALLKDNKRALIFGKTTAGAGCAFCYDSCHHSMKGPYAISNLKIPTQMILRSNGKMIEDQGVEPDIACDLTLSDYTSGGEDYSKKLNNVVDQQLGKNRCQPNVFGYEAKNSK